MSRNRRQACELIADLSAKLTESLIANGIGKDVAAEIGSEVADKISAYWRGNNIYFPIDQAFRRNAKIYADFTGDNHDKLVFKYGVSLQHVYRVVDEYRAAEIADRQGGLFPDPPPESAS